MSWVKAGKEASRFRDGLVCRTCGMSPEGKGLYEERFMGKQKASDFNQRMLDTKVTRL